MDSGRTHHPAIALLSALLIPGAGQAYNGRPVKGVFLLLLSVLALPWIYSVIDAWLSARRMVASGGRFGRGGIFWVFLHGWLVANIALTVLIGLTLAGKIT